MILINSLVLRGELWFVTGTLRGGTLAGAFQWVALCLLRCRAGQSRVLRVASEPQDLPLGCSVSSMPLERACDFGSLGDWKAGVPRRFHHSGLHYSLAGRLSPVLGFVRSLPCWGSSSDEPLDVASGFQSCYPNDQDSGDDKPWLFLLIL